MMQRNLRKFRPNWRIGYGLFFAAVVGLVLTGADCDGGIEPKEAFMLVYIDAGERIRVRYSDDGVSWSLGDLVGATADGGVGAAASEDAVGVTRVIVHNGNVADMRFRFGIGPQVWDQQDAGSSSWPTPRGYPKMTYGGTPGWLVTNLDGFKPKVYRYSSSQSTMEDVSPADPQMDLGSMNVHSAPAIVSRHGRVLLGYLRHTGIGNNAVLQDLQILPGTVGSGVTPSWDNAYTFAVAEPGYGPPLTRPAFSHDNTDFYIALVRRAESGSALRLFVYSSSDGLSWQLAKTLDQVPQVDPATLNVGIAAKSDGTMLAMFTTPGTAKIYRYTSSQSWYELSAAAVFGSNTPNWYGFSLLSAGQPETP